jgi:hypothetical protein
MPMVHAELSQQEKEQIKGAHLNKATETLAKTMFISEALKSVLVRQNPSSLAGDTLNYTEKFRGMYTVGWNYRRKRPNSVGKRLTVDIIFCPSPNFFTTLSVFIQF